MKRWRNAILWIILGLLWVVTTNHVGLTPRAIWKGIPGGWRYLTRVFPPDLSILPDILPDLLETYFIAYTAIMISTVIALPLSFLGAFNVNSNRLSYQIVRSLFNFCRGFPDIFLALLFVSMLGLGPLPAVLALAIHSVGTLGKYFSEGTEAANLREIAEAMRLDGATEWQVALYGYIPTLKVLYTGYILYYFEYNVRTGSALGLVGAGGLGIHINEAVALFRYHRVGTLILVIAVIVVVNDRLSAIIRRRLKE